MTEALTVPPIFGGKEIRVIEKDGETWMPCKDISLALGLDRTACYQHVKRNRDFFGETATDGDILSHGEDDLWVNEQGMYLLLARISTGKIQPAIKASITRFRQDIPKFLQQYRKHEIIPAEQKDIDTLVQQHLHIADAMAQFAHVDRGIAVSVALARVEYDTGADLTCYKNLIRKDRQQAPGYLTPTQSWAVYRPAPLIRCSSSSDTRITLAIVGSRQRSGRTTEKICRSPLVSRMVGFTRIISSSGPRRWSGSSGIM